jgi:regulatory protein YycI of two-component signal transduction system YycFG
VFFILNLFLYTQYLDTYNKGKKIVVLGETTKIEARLKEDNITYTELPTFNENIPYYSGEIKIFTAGEVPYFTNQNTRIEHENKLVVTMDKPVKLQESATRNKYEEFVHSFVNEGDNYTLWSVDEEKREATFFQKVNNLTLYYNIQGYVKIYWNEENRVYEYEQTMLEKHEKLEKKPKLLTSSQVLQVLYGKNLLKPDSQILKMNLGYSTIVQITQTQVFAPTWEIRIRLADKTEETYFLNAENGKIVDIQNDLLEIVEQEEDLD